MMLIVEGWFVLGCWIVFLKLLYPLFNGIGPRFISVPDQFIGFQSQTEGLRGSLAQSALQTGFPAVVLSTFLILCQ